MQLLKQMQQKTMLFLILAIMILCGVFIFISCGTDPQLKITDPETGQFAIDFSKCPGSSCSGLLPSLSFVNDTNKLIADKDLTIEAWVKSKADSPNDFTGGIFGRFDTGGIVLYVKEGIPKVAIRRIAASGTATATADYIVSGTSTLLKDVWTHIAGVLSNTDHSTVAGHPSCGGSESETPHLDIYVNNVIEGCNATFGASNDPATVPEFAGEPGDKILSVGAFAENLTFDLDGLNNSTFPGVIDEARLWGVERTPAQIDDCWDRELGLDSGSCDRSSDDLIIYLRLNEGKGEIINDWAGLGSGNLFKDGTLAFTEGWVAGAPVTKHD